MNRVKLSDLAKMSDKEKRDAIKKLVESKPDENYIINRLAEYESKYGITTTEMIEKFKTGEIEDTHDTSVWLILSTCIKKQ